jgi:Protein of unknown function (DUF2442)
MHPRAAEAGYDRKRRRIFILLSNGLELALPVHLAQELRAEDPTDLEEIEISPAGLVLHWPKLGTELYLPALLKDILGTQESRWREYWTKWHR